MVWEGFFLCVFFCFFLFLIPFLYSPLPPFVSWWEDEHLIKSYLGASAFTDILLQMLLLLGRVAETHQKILGTTGKKAGAVEPQPVGVGRERGAGGAGEVLGTRRRRTCRPSRARLDHGKARVGSASPARPPPSASTPLVPRGTPATRVSPCPASVGCSRGLCSLFAASITYTGDQY